jgi:hypothetical protein
MYDKNLPSLGDVSLWSSLDTMMDLRSHLKHRMSLPRSQQYSVVAFNDIVHVFGGENAYDMPI